MCLPVVCLPACLPCACVCTLQVQQPSVEQKPPKSLLQQHCQKHGLGMPKYSKLAALPAAAEALAAATGQTERYRYKVLVAPAAAAAAPGGGKGGGGGKRFGIWAVSGPKTYQLFADEDGWGTIEEAQNAAAARALFGLHKQALLLAAAAGGKGGASGSSSSKAAVGGPAASSAEEGESAKEEQAAAAAAAATVAAAAAAAGSVQSPATAGVLEQMKGVYEQLPQPWAGFWDRWWVAEGLGGGGDGSGRSGAAAGVEEVLAAEQQQQREDFVRWVGLMLLCLAGCWGFLAIIRHHVGLQATPFLGGGVGFW